LNRCSGVNYHRNAKLWGTSGTKNKRHTSRTLDLGAWAYALITQKPKKQATQVSKEKKR